MPNYTYKNKVTGEEITVNMTMAEHDTYLDDKPDWEQMILVANFVDPVSIGVPKPPADFQKGVIGRMKEKVHGNNLNRSKFNIPREW